MISSQHTRVQSFIIQEDLIQALACWHRTRRGGGGEKGSKSEGGLDWSGGFCVVDGPFQVHILLWFACLTIFPGPLLSLVGNSQNVNDLFHVFFVYFSRRVIIRKRDIISWGRKKTKKRQKTEISRPIVEKTEITSYGMHQISIITELK